MVRILSALVKREPPAWKPRLSHLATSKRECYQGWVPVVQTLESDSIRWTPGKIARIWFVQPRLDLPASPPFISRPIAGEPSPLQLLEEAVRIEPDLPEPDEAPVFYLLPEFSLNPSEIPRYAQLVLSARPNTVFISGVGQLTKEQARDIEPEPGADLLDATSAHLYANCALIGFGGSQNLRLQPKIVPSWAETARQAI